METRTFVVPKEDFDVETVCVMSESVLGRPDVGKRLDGYLAVFSSQRDSVVVVKVKDLRF
jgi:hypothetical protein